MSKNLTNSSHIKVVTNGDNVSLDFINEYYNKNEVDNKLTTKVNTESGKALSSNDFTNALKTKLNGIATNAQVNVIETIKVDGTALTTSSKAVNINLSGKANTTDVYTKTQSDNRYISDNNYVHTDSNFTQAEKTKLATIESNAQENIIEKILVNGIEQTVKNKTVNIAVENATVYGVKRKVNNNTSSAWERIKDAVGLVANATHDGTAVQNDFDNIYPWSDIYTYNYNTTTKKEVARIGDANFKFDGTNGEVLTYIPEFFWKKYRKTESNGDIYEYILISKYAIDGFFKSEAFSVGRYNSYYDGTKIHSYSGYCPEINRNITSFRTLSKAVGEGFGQLDYRYTIIQMLYLVEYADFNTQSKLGKGFAFMRVNDADKSLVAESSVNRIIIATANANNFKVGQQISIGTTLAWNWSIAKNRTILSITEYSSGGVTGKAINFDGDPVNIALNNVIWTTGQKSGSCNILEMKSGCLANDGKSGIIYRGIENFFGNVWQFVDGINIKDRLAYVCYNPLQYTVDKFTDPYNALSYVNGNTNGYTKTLGFDENNPLMSFPVEVGASDSTGTSDYYYSNDGNRIALVGGYWVTYSNAGAWYWNFNSTSGSANYHLGSRLLRYQS